MKSFSTEKSYFNKRLSSTLKCRLDLNGNHDGLSDPFTKKRVCTRVYKIQVDNSLACENWKQIIPTQIFRLINMQINGGAETILREGEQSAPQDRVARAHRKRMLSHHKARS